MLVVVRVKKERASASHQILKSVHLFTSVGLESLSSRVLVTMTCSAREEPTGSMVILRGNSLQAHWLRCLAREVSTSPPPPLIFHGK